MIPVEEQGPEANKIGELSVPAQDKVAEATAGPPLGVGYQTACQAEPEVENGKSPTETGTTPLQSEVRTPQAAPDPKKEATKQRQTVIVAAPKEEAEMVDITAGPKKRGRPRKNPVVDPPDPHKGSVLYPEEGVCADPVDKGAILGEGGGKPPSSDKERQLATDIAGGKT